MPELELSKREQKELVLKNLFNSPLVTIVGSILTTFIIAAVFLKIAGPVPISLTQTSVEKLSTFDVVGRGSSFAVPDTATANFGITVSRPSVSAAQEEVNQTLIGLREALASVGVEEREIKTISYNISPNYSGEGRGIVGYTVSSQVKVTFRDFERLNQALEKTTQAGANLIGNLTFELSEEKRQQAEEEARKQAIKQAKEKAEKVAREAGFSLGRVLNVVERRVGEPPFLQARQAVTEETVEVSPGLAEVVIEATLSFETR